MGWRFAWRKRGEPNDRAGDRRGQRLRAHPVGDEASRGWRRGRKTRGKAVARCVFRAPQEGSRSDFGLPFSARKRTCFGKSFFNDINPLAWICDMRFARDIRLRRVICLRACVDLYHITFRVSEKYHVCREANISHRAKRDISL